MKKTIAIIILLTTILILLEKTNHSETNKKYVFWALVGSNPQEKHINPYELTRGDKQIDTASILFSIRREPKSIEQISKETEIEIKKIKRKLTELEKCDLVREHNSRFIVNFPFWDNELRDAITNLGLELSDKIVVMLKKELPNLKNAFSKTSLPKQGYAWEDMVLLIIGGILLDTGVNDRGLRNWGIFDKERDTPLRPGKYYYWFRAVEGGWGNYWKFGHDMINKNNFTLWFGMFYGQHHEKRMNWSLAWDVLDKNTGHIIFPLIQNGSTRIDLLQQKTQLSPESLSTILQQMEKAKIIKIKDAVVYPDFPIFHERDIKYFFSKIDTISNRIINEIYVPFLPKIEKTWKETKPPKWNIDKIDKFIIREVYDRPYNLTLDRLIKEGILPPAPAEPPFHYWGMHGYFEIL